MKKKQRHQKHHDKPKKGTIPARLEELIGGLATAPLVFILVIVFIIGINMTVKNVYLKPEKTTTHAVALKEQVPLEATLNKVSRSEGDDAFKPDVGEEFLILNVSVVQNLKRPIWLSPLQQSYVLDDKNNKYNLSPVSMDAPFDAHEYQSGERAQGDVSYLVKKDTGKLRWCYEISQDNAKVCQDIN